MANRFHQFASSFVKIFKVKSIQFTITVSLTLIIAIVLLFVGVMYQRFSQTAEQNAELNTQQIVDQVRFNLEDYLRNMSDLFAVAHQKIEGNQNTSMTRLTDQLSTILDTRNDIVSLTLFTDKGGLVTSLPSVELRKNTDWTQQSWFKSAMENKNHLSFSQPHVQNLYKGQYKWVVSMSKSITFYQNNQKIDGVLLIDVNFKTIDNLCQRVSLGKKGYVYIIDESAGNIVYHPQQQLIYIGLKFENVEQALKYTYGSFADNSHGDKRLITVRTVNNIGWKIIGVSYKDEIVTTQQEIRTFIVWLLIVVLVFVLLISAFMSTKISRPIRKLKTSMEQVEQGDFNISIHIKGTDEVEQLSRRFNIMVARIRQLMDQIIGEQEAKRKYEFEVLQAQINPHFLYNTLNSIVRMVGTGKNEDVITSITSLSKLFRISLSRGKAIITVEEELEHIRNYLILQKIRYKNKFDYVIDVEDEVLPYLTIKLILQPIVENAIYHGIEFMPSGGLIQISARIEAGKILFQVRDNGVGIPPQMLQTILSGQVKSDKGSGVGFKNVHERIKLFHGPDYGLEIESEPDEGTCVSIWMPLMKEERIG
ncbi:sensor histidine kinase [Paenibacillus sp. GP183]|uniref:cache domain-containing sensor histidine kinase n=1 Tax=Paenibacillus sp. GP183 TaxID=1882751 RepID=UPI00089828EF|nr:sensor histidine kinase [Paenibacillus sp. GP183]SEC47494.1 two-component system, sensor histidine kinase YesM [Paenibacillus sp. GP183]